MSMQDNFVASFSCLGSFDVMLRGSASLRGKRRRERAEGSPNPLAIKDRPYEFPRKDADSVEVES